MSERPSTVRLDARFSPALAVSPELLRIRPHRRSWTGAREERTQPLLYDETLRWLAVSDRIVSDQAARALLEVKEGKLHVKEGHARWSTYLRAFVPMTARWCQQEMRRARALRDYPALAAAWAAGVLSKSHLRIVLRAVTQETEEVWLQRASGSSVRELEEMAARERETDRGAGAAADAQQDDPEEARSIRRVVMAPPGVAVLVSQAVDVARKMAAYQIGIGAAVEMMSMEMMAGLNEYAPSAGFSKAEAISAAGETAPDVAQTVPHLSARLRQEMQEAAEPRQASAPKARPEERAQQTCPEDGRNSGGRAAHSRRSISLGDHVDLRREMGVGWERIHQQMEAATGRWRDLPSDLPARSSSTGLRPRMPAPTSASFSGRDSRAGSMPCVVVC